MLPPQAMSALHDRIRQQLAGGGKDAFGFAAPAAAPASTPRRAAAVDPHDLQIAKFEKSNKRAEPGVQVFMVVVVLGLLAGVIALVFQAMWDEAMLLGGLTLFVALMACAVWRGTMRTVKPKGKG